MGIPRIVNFRTFLFSAVAAILAVIFFVEYYRNAALALIVFALWELWRSYCASFTARMR